MGRAKGWVSMVTGRPVMRSPGQPGLGRDAERAFWRWVATGLSTEAAAAACGVSLAVGVRWFRQAGGMPPVRLSPPSGRYLSFEEREDLAVYRAQGLGVRAIALRLNRSASTISRVLRRNASVRGGTLTYRASTAQWKAERAARRPMASCAGVIESRSVNRAAHLSGVHRPPPPRRGCLPAGRTMERCWRRCLGPPEPPRSKYTAAAG